MKLFEDLIFKTTEQGRNYAETMNTGEIVAVECKDCGSLKSVDQFAKGNSRGLQYYPYCKECAKRRREEYLQKKEAEATEIIETIDTAEPAKKVLELTAQQREIFEAFKKRGRDYAYVAQFARDAVTVLEYVIDNEGVLGGA